MLTQGHEKQNKKDEVYESDSARNSPLRLGLVFLRLITAQGEGAPFMASPGAPDFTPSSRHASAPQALRTAISAGQVFYVHIRGLTPSLTYSHTF